MKKFEVSEEFVKAAHSEACPDWKRRIEKEIPEAFKSVLEVGEWYKCIEGDRKWIVTPRKDYKDTGRVYGFDCGKWRDPDYNWTWRGADNLALLTPAAIEEVQEALINEAKKRGFKEGVRVLDADGDNGTLLEGSAFRYLNIQRILEFGCPTIFRDGVWATIIEEPIKKVTLADIEAKFGCKVEIV